MKLKILLLYLLLTSSLTVLIATAAKSEEVGIGVSKHLKSTPTDANSNQAFTVESIREIQRISELVYPAKSAEILRQLPQLSQGGATATETVYAVTSTKQQPEPVFWLCHISILLPGKICPPQSGNKTIIELSSLINRKRYWMLAIGKKLLLYT